MLMVFNAHIYFLSFFFSRKMTIFYLLDKFKKACLKHTSFSFPSIAKPNRLNVCARWGWMNVNLRGNRWGWCPPGF